MDKDEQIDALVNSTLAKGHFSAAQARQVSVLVTAALMIERGELYWDAAWQGVGRLSDIPTATAH
jgi:hypothetical protein